MYRAALKASRHLLCSTSNALLLSIELLSRLSRSILSSACIALYVGTELLSRLPRHYPCSISYALLVSTELLSRFSRYLSISLHRSFVRTEQLSRLPRFLLCYPLREGFSKAQSLGSNLFLKGFASLYVCILNYSQGFQKIFSALSAPVFWYVQALQGKALFIVNLPDAAHFPSFKPHPKGSARLQGFTLRGQYFFSRALQGFSKASLSKILVKGYEREGFNKRSSSSFNQSDTVPETNRYAPPTS